MNKTSALALAAALGTAAAIGYAIGSCTGKEESTLEVSAHGERSAEEFAAAKARISELERDLAAIRGREARMAALAAKAEEAVGEAMNGSAAGVTAVSAGTNADILAGLKKHLPEREFSIATNALASLRTKMSEQAKEKMEILSSLDTSRLDESERASHEEFQRLVRKRQSFAGGVKGGLLDGNALKEMMEVDLKLALLAKKERAILAGELARDLGYAGDDVEIIREAIENVFDCTTFSGLNGTVQTINVTHGEIADAPSGDVGRMK